MFLEVLDACLMYYLWVNTRSKPTEQRETSEQRLTGIWPQSSSDTIFLSFYESAKSNLTFKKEHGYSSQAMGNFEISVEMTPADSYKHDQSLNFYQVTYKF